MPDIDDWRVGICEGDPQASDSLANPSPPNSTKPLQPDMADESQPFTSISESRSGSSPGSSVSGPRSGSSTESFDDLNYPGQILRPQGINVENTKVHEEVFPATASSHIATVVRAADAFLSLPIRISFADILKAFQSTPGGPLSIVTPAQKFVEESRRIVGPGRIVTSDSKKIIFGGLSGKGLSMAPW